MKLIIDIPDVMYKNPDRFACDVLARAIEDGKVLPKGHGRLIDMDDKEHLTVCWDKNGHMHIEAPIIIEADGDREK